MLKVRVPATTANMGAGFDCFGMALNLYNEVAVEESDQFIIEGAADVPTTEENLIYQVIKQFYEEIGKPLPMLKLVQTDEIPMTRGLGSSSACIVAGLMVANELAGQPMTRDDLAQRACQIEGHPDNVAPAIYGGFVVAAMEDNQLHSVKIAPSDALSFITFIPDFQLSTEEARQILPQTYTKADAIFNISRASLFVASMISQNWDNLRVAVNDRIHQPYRGTLIPNMDKIFEYAQTEGAKGVFMSGAGPTIIAITPRANEINFANKMKQHLTQLENSWETKILHADVNGAQVVTERENINLLCR
ncbi:MAG: homoserine kinase [Defluviitaleaceae bacterium]|nr:homoserine kinase [Defluviitaleaceae bacterium]